MKNLLRFLIISVVINFSFCDLGKSQKARCLNPPSTSKKVEKHIKECQAEVRVKVLEEAFEILHNRWEQESHHLQHIAVEFDKLAAAHDFGAQKRSYIHPSPLMPREERRIAGCLLHCVYEKNNAIDSLGWPTLDGLVEFYSDGVNEHGYFMATLRATDECLKRVSHHYQVNRLIPPDTQRSCDLSFDIFDCVSDHITGYCLDLYRDFD